MTPAPPAQKRRVPRLLPAPVDVMGAWGRLFVFLRGRFADIRPRPGRGGATERKMQKSTKLFLLAVRQDRISPGCSRSVSERKKNGPVLALPCR